MEHETEEYAHEVRRHVRGYLRQVGLHQSAAYILGVAANEEPPRIAVPEAGRPVAEPYVCIGVQSTKQCKYWNNPTGWHGAAGVGGALQWAGK